MSRLSELALRRLAVHKFGSIQAPGAGILRQVEENGAVFDVVSYGDAFDIVQGKRRIFTFEASPRVMVRLAWWLLWSYWIRGTWFGLKLRVWRWAVLKSAGMEKDDGDQTGGDAGVAGTRRLVNGAARSPDQSRVRLPRP